MPALRADDGKLYTLMGDLHGFKPRDRVCVVPNYIEMTYCLQGTTAHVDWIGPGPCPGQLSTAGADSCETIPPASPAAR